jgi:hypothetical protein
MLVSQTKLFQAFMRETVRRQNHTIAVAQRHTVIQGIQKGTHLLQGDIRTALGAVAGRFGGRSFQEV